MKSEPVRLQKFVAEQGLASRRQAEVLIEEGRLTINGQPAQLGAKVIPGEDEVRLDGKLVRASRGLKTLVLAMHKPPGYLCSNRDPHEKKTIFTLLPPSFAKERLFCAGRLDKESEGLLILTNDGALTQKLTHPSHRVTKRYRVTLDRDYDEKHTRRLLDGISWEGERLKVEKVIPLTRGKERRQLELHMQHGKKREIRRLLFACGYGVNRLVRFQIGRLELRGLSKGRVRVLQEEEIGRLFD
ncbi:MAG: pseudouridine synthase [Verrucomicrobiota bacterium]